MIVARDELIEHAELIMRSEMKGCRGDQVSMRNEEIEAKGAEGAEGRDSPRPVGMVVDDIENDTPSSRVEGLYHLPEL